MPEELGPEPTETEKFLAKKVSEERVEDVGEAHDEASFLKAIREWENLSYEEAYTKMRGIFEDLQKRYKGSKEIFALVDSGALRDFAGPIIEVAKRVKRPTSILVTGLGVSGKTTTMSALGVELARVFSEEGTTVLAINRDYYDQRELPPADIRVVENANAISGIPDPLEARAKDPAEREKIRKILDEELEKFDLIVYTNPSLEDYERYWRERVEAWRRRGLLKKEGPRSEAAAEKALKHREEWLARDKERLDELAEKGTKVIYINPDPLLKAFFRAIIESGL